MGCKYLLHSDFRNFVFHIRSHCLANLGAQGFSAESSYCQVRLAHRPLRAWEAGKSCSDGSNLLWPPVFWKTTVNCNEWENITHWRHVLLLRSTLWYWNWSCSVQAVLEMDQRRSHSRNKGRTSLQASSRWYIQQLLDHKFMVHHFPLHGHHQRIHNPCDYDLGGEAAQIQKPHRRD